MMFSRALLVVVIISAVAAATPEGFNFLDKIKSGFKMAGNFFSSDQASKVANLVSDALGKTHTKKNSDGKPNNIFSGFLRLFGLDSKKIGAIAVNAIIIVAQMISSSISLTPPSQLVQSRKITDGSPLDWMLSNPAVADLLSMAKDENLSDHVLEYVTERSMDENSGCVQLLICKTTPFVKGMQKAISINANGEGDVKNHQEVLFRYFPTAEDIADHGDSCEKKYNYCTIPL